jgi:hypothetical protein
MKSTTRPTPPPPLNPKALTEVDRETVTAMRERLTAMGANEASKDRAVADYETLAAMGFTGTASPSALADYLANAVTSAEITVSLELDLPEADDLTVIYNCALFETSQQAEAAARELLKVINQVIKKHQRTSSNA